MPLTISDLRARVETDLDDATVQRILDAASQDVVRHAGGAGSTSETHMASGSRMLSLLRRADSVTAITERRTLDSDAVALAANDWRRVGDYQILRLVSGDNPAVAWGCEVVVTYLPEIDEELRDRVILDLCQVDIDFRSYESESVGDWSGSQADYEERRTYLLAQVREGRSLVV